VAVFWKERKVAMGIRLQNVSAGYGKFPGKDDVLKGLELTITEGHTVCILGENGSGKSTLLRVLAGILEYRGSIQVDTVELRELDRKALSARVAFMTQFSSVYFSYTVWETVMLGRYLKEKGFLGRPTGQDRCRVEECLSMTGLSELKEVPIGELSGGQLQRVFLARTFAQDTPYLLLDEPTNHLDLKYQAQLTEHLLKWTGVEREYPDGSVKKNTLIGVFHDINLALRIADELIVMKDGEILSWGRKEQILQSNVLDQAYGIPVEEYMRKQLKLWEK